MEHSYISLPRMHRVNGFSTPTHTTVKPVSMTLMKLEQLFCIENENPDGSSLDDFDPDANHKIDSESSDI